MLAMLALATITSGAALSAGQTSQALKPTENNVQSVADLTSVLAKVDELCSQSAFVPAQNLLNIAERMHPGTYQLTLAQAKLWSNMGLHARAKILYENLHKQQPTAVEPLVALSQLSLESLRIDEAVRYAREAVKVAPASNAAHLALAAAVIADNSDTAAKLELDFIEQKFAASAEYYYLRSQFLAAHDDRTGAISALEQAVKAKPANAQWWMQLGSLYEQDGKYNEALDAFSRYLRLNPTSIEALGKAAAIYEYNFHDYDRAISYYRDILKIDKNIVDASAGIERCQRKNKDLAAALKDQLWRFLRQTDTLGGVPRTPPSSPRN
jgi:tetratricopeptide (TPR) repeat protein